MYSGAKLFIDAFTDSTSAHIGCFTFSSNSGLRGKNHSRLLLRARLRKNVSASAGKPGNPVLMRCSLIIELMVPLEEAQARLAEIPNLTVSTGTPLSRHTRFGIGGPADLY